MHYCPKCYYEYEPRVLVCPDCGSPLIDGPAPTKKPSVRTSDDIDALLLFESQDLLKLRFLLDLLDQEGIPYATRKLTHYGGAASSDLTAMAQSTASTVGGIAQVYVAPPDLERAKELLEALEGTPLTGDEDTDLEDTP